MLNLKNKTFFSKSDFDKVKKSRLSEDLKLSLISDMLRLNTLQEIWIAKSGHIGASFSVMEILTVLYHKIMKINIENPNDRTRDILIVSKGHAAAGVYATLASVGFFPIQYLATFRKYNGLQGHVDISTPGIDGNTGSLGMGISKAKGYAWVQKYDKLKSRSFVISGDGELQEGQIWEALLSAAKMKLDNLYLIVDRNRIQTDRETEKICSIEPLEDKLRAFGWEVISVNGNSCQEIINVIEKLENIRNKPKAIIANTIKGKGVSFMEKMPSNNELYKWHGAVTKEEDYIKAFDEICSRIKNHTEYMNIKMVEKIFPRVTDNNFKGTSLKKAFSETLIEVGSKNKNIVVLDGDLEEDCGLSPFARKFPDRFIEIGIAEQDMVSMAGGLARAGKIPIVNTYTAFLTSRANEQIFNNATEESKILYIGHLAGILPAKPGKSHQGIRDISLLKAIPNMIMGAPGHKEELRQMINMMIEKHKGPCYIRLEHSQPRFDIDPPKNYKLEFGKGSIIAHGTDVAIITYGPLMLAEAMNALEELKKRGLSTKIINLPWLNNINKKWLLKNLKNIKKVVCIENSATAGQSEEIIKIINGYKKVYTFKINDFGQSGDNLNILKRYKLDTNSIVTRLYND
ncbi:MAG: transketolase C-terminal domain-containing protein [Candidatus Micrarchaeia archaeon]